MLVERDSLTDTLRVSLWRSLGGKLHSNAKRSFMRLRGSQNVLSYEKFRAVETPIESLPIERMPLRVFPLRESYWEMLVERTLLRAILERVLLCKQFFSAPCQCRRWPHIGEFSRPEDCPKSPMNVIRNECGSLQSMSTVRHSSDRALQRDLAVELSKSPHVK